MRNMNHELEADLSRLFYPRTVAIVGSTPKRGVVWSSGNAFINGCIKQSFQGKIYPVHPRAKSILGYKCYPSIKDIPGNIDLVIFCVPSSAVLDVLEDCAEKKVKFVHLLTAGFTETGRQEDADVEEKLLAIARKAGIRIVGPNCMGLYCPDGGISWNGEMPDRIGTTGLFSQSGQLANMITLAGEKQGVHFSKVVSFGNACDLKAHDFLCYMANDPKTKIITAYIEGLKRGREFFELARKITKEKPMVVWKGGQTEGGARATQSHTAALAGSYQVWESMCRQAGIISVNSIQEMVGTISALKRLPMPSGKNVAILGGAGGGSVTMTDLAEKEGLFVPHLSDESIRLMGEFIPIQGSSVKNPLDILPHMRNRESFEKLMTILKNDANIDALVFSLNIAFIYREGGRLGVNYFLRMIAKSHEWLEKPMFLILDTFNTAEMLMLRNEAEEILVARKMTAFPTFEIAARALTHLYRYKRFANRPTYQPEKNG